MMGENNLPVAVSAFENAMSLNPTNYRALYKLIISTHDNCQGEKAIQMLSEPDLAGSSRFEQYYQMTMLYTDKSNFAAALKKLDALNTTAAFLHTEIRADLEDILETLGVIDRSVINWDRINEASQWLLEKEKMGHNSIS
jgi:hypothetical protein